VTVACQFDEQSDVGRIVLTPNRSWTWRANLLFVATLAGVSLAVALAFCLQGLWMILPFTVLEQAVLLGALYYCVRRTHTTEVLVLSRNRLIFERGIRRPTLRRAFERYFARFVVEPPTHRWGRRRVALACRGETLEIGRFLGDEDRELLIRALRRTIQRLEVPSSIARRQ
jgi:uncharacterized membrane protein